MSAINPSALAERLDNAAKSACATPQLSIQSAISVSDAYKVQTESLNRRFNRGERIVGLKMGFTSRAKMAQMGVSDVICGRLTDAMLVEDGGSISLRQYVHPRVEPEIAFLLKAPLRGKTTPMQALAAVEAIAPALEIIDSRYESFKFSLPDVIADNSSSSSFVTGPWNRPDADVSNLGLVMSINGRAREVGSTAALLGHPLRSLAAAARLALVAGLDELKAGWIVLAGGATAAAALEAGDYVSLEMQKLGRVAFTVEA